MTYSQKPLKLAKTNNYIQKLKKFLFILVLIKSNLVFAQKSEPSVIEATRINEKITLDGLLNEAAWQNNSAITNFTQRDPVEGAPVSESTKVMFLYDDMNLYIGLWAYDSDASKIAAKQMKRDFLWGGDDNFEILISTYNDKRNAYLLVTNPNGARADVLVSSNMDFNRDWNGVWDVRTRRNNEGWFAEYIIPLTTLRFAKLEEQLWGLNMERNIRHKNEQANWQGWSRDYELETLGQMGTMKGLKNLPVRKIIELKPFITGGFQNTSDNGSENLIKIGGDLNYLLSPTLKLNLTANTDFSQVESDRAQINLTRFSLYLPEKRDFFLEDKKNLEFGLDQSTQLFYTRRIGLDNGTQIPILGGARVTGKAGKSNLGFLSMQTAAKDSIPTTNYTVFRLRQDVLKESTVGMIVTAKNDSGHYNYVYGIDADYRSSELFGDKVLAFGGSYTQSFTSDSSNIQNSAYAAYLMYPNDLVEFSLSTTSVPNGYNPEVGFVRRTNYTVYNAEFSLKPRPKNIPWIRQFDFKPFEINYYNTASTGKKETVSFEFRPLGIEFTSGDLFEFNYQHSFDRLDEDYNIFNETYIPAGEYSFDNLELQFESYSGRSFYGGAGYRWGDFYTGRNNSLEMMLAWNVNKHLNLSADWIRNDIDLETGSFTTHEVGGRIEYALTPKIYTSLFGHWNNEENELLFNYRFNLIPKIGSDFYFVVNQAFSTENQTLSPLYTVVMLKLVWRFVL
ncbi:MAG: DUF5916 domain-containing protein [Bacteroidales bacterium]